MEKPPLAPVFITGHFRSGTTLLQSLLDGHPELVVDAGDSRFFHKALPKLRFRSAAGRLAAAREHLLYLFREDNVYHAKFLSHVPVAEVHRLFSENVARSQQRLADYLPAYLRAYGAASGQLTERSRYWVEKTPNTEYFAHRILDWFPDAFVLTMVRDPRDVFSSIKLRAERKGALADPASFAFAWRKSLVMAERLRARLGKERCCLVRYEDLAAAPRGPLKRIRATLGIADHPLLERPTKGGGTVSWEGNRASRERSTTLSVVTYDWENVLSPVEIQVLSRLLPEAQAVGYALPAPSHGPSVRERLFRSLRELSFQARYRLSFRL